MNRSGQKLKGSKREAKARTYIMFLLMLFFFTSTPTVAQKTYVTTGDKIIITDGKNVRRHTQSNGINSFNIEYKGTIEVTDDDKDVKSISPGGYIEISKTTFGSRRSILIEASSNGLRREYYESRKKVDYEPEGRKWLAEILPDVVRSTGIAAESRVNRYYKQGGVDAVLNEVGRLESDYVRSIYGKILLQKDGLSSNDLVKAAKGLADKINSDYYLAEMLKSNSSQFLKNDKTAEAYFEAVSNIGSDYYTAAVLKEALDNHQASARSMTQILNASKNIGSDYYKATVLSQVLDQDNANDHVVGEIISCTKNIGSDYYQTQILSKAISKKGLSGSSSNELLEAVANVSSDYYMATVFSKLVENKLDNDVNIKLIGLLDDKMSSDYYAASVLSKMVKHQDLNDQAVARMAQAISNMNSDNYASSILKNASESRNLSKSTLISLVKAAGGIKSDFYKSSALQHLAPLVKNSDAEVKAAYTEAAKRINSDTYYGRAMRAID
ncbi:hypothetical protein C900_01588 [Fulvivirga imtechensis AK7]|uniref:Uncharacterized protein n=1 Tax=Fulvivirga imtechensis AK7 TaxID=1237149 RepID=L8JTK5_9BACT|nr:hypothetical protein [Fulvivirga imtechensis]ELR72306.1 hypothetical protein C900_01588 [Fulvivirga imtechensis AK7]